MDQEAIAQLHEEQGNWLSRHRVELVKAILQSNGISRTSRIIDLGAGSGFGAKVLSEMATCDALEPSPFFVSAIRRQSGVREVFQDVIPPRGDHSFDAYDVAVMMDVLEHLEDEDEALSWVRTILKSPQSKLVVTVPAYQWLYSYHDVAVHHFRRYSRKSLVRALSRSGFFVEKTSYFVTFLFPLALASRVIGILLNRIRKSPLRKARSSVSPTFNILFSMVCKSERTIMKRTGLPFGLSLVAVCRRGPEL